MKVNAVIAAITMATPVGLRSAQTCASVRAGIARFEELFWKNKTYTPIVMAAISDNCLPGLAQEIIDDTSLSLQEKRIIKIAGLSRAEISGAGIKQKIPLILGLPQGVGIKQVDANNILKYIAIQTGLNIDLDKSKAIAKGRASGLLAVHTACELLKIGKADMIMAGGCDSYKNLDRLGFLNVESRLKSEINIDGFIPGEGVGFLLLMTEVEAKRQGKTILGRLKATATGFEEGHLYSEIPYKGEGLSQTFRLLFNNDTASLEKIKTVYSNMNGESHWAKEWGVSYIRFQDKIKNDFEIVHPADSFGDLGAASGPVMIGLAITGMQRGYKKGPALIYASSDRGDRGAIILDKQ
jgi:3-oxoacyl-[acyl-carrier-protein] synthase-1